MRQVKSRKLPTTETGSGANKTFFLFFCHERVLLLCVCSYVRHCRELRCCQKVSNSRHRQAMGHSLQFSIDCPSQAVLKQGCIPQHVFPLSGRVGTSEREGGGDVEARLGWLRQHQQM